MAKVELDAIHKEFTSARPVVAVRDASLVIPQGDYVAIEGESGSGKSTLLSIVGLLDAPTSGDLTIGGILATSKSRGRANLRSETFSYIFQAFHLLEGRAAIDSVMLPLLYRGLSHSDQRARAKRALDTVGVGELADTAGRYLSGGQRQRVAIARALASEAPVLIADEPTGNLDSENSSRVMDAIDTVNRSGASVLLVTHSQDVARRASRKLRMVDGAIVSDQRLRDVAAAGIGIPRPPGHAGKVRLGPFLRDVWISQSSSLGRSFWQSASVAVAVALIVVTLGLSNSARNQVSDLFDATASTEVTGLLTVHPGSVPLTEEQIVDLARLNGVTAVADAVRTTTFVGNPSSSDVVQAPWIQVRGDVVAAGRLSLTDGSSPAVAKLSPGQALVGQALADRLGLAQAGTDTTLLIDGQPYTLAGVIEKSPRQAGWIGSVLTSPVEGGAADPIEESVLLVTDIGASHQVAQEMPLIVNPYETEQLRVDSPPDPSFMRARIEDSVQGSLTILTLVAVVGGLLSVALASSIAASARRVEFGLRRAVGARGSQIALMLAAESAFMGVVGALVGLVVGLMTILAVTLANHWTPIFDPILVGFAFAAGLAISMIGSVVGLARASRMQPNDALRPIQ